MNFSRPDSNPRFNTRHSAILPLKPLIQLLIFYTSQNLYTAIGMKLSGPNPMAQCTLLLTPNHAFPVHPIANAESGLNPVQPTANSEPCLPSAPYC